MPHELEVTCRSHLCLYACIPYLFLRVFSSQIHTRLSFLFFFLFFVFPLTSISPDFKRISTERLFVFLKIKGLSPKFGCKGESCRMLVPRELGNWTPCDSWTVLLGFVISWPLDPSRPVHLSFIFLVVFQEGKEMLSPAEAAVGGLWVTGVPQRATRACCACPEAGSYR